MDIRFAHPEEGQACNDFHNRIYNDTRTYEQWRWGYILDSYPTETMPFTVVEDNGSIVGTQAFIMIRMIDRNGVFWTAKSEDTLVDPNYRGQKLFEKMYALLFDYFQETRTHCIWGFTPATKAFIRLGFDIPGKITQLFMPFKNDAVIRAVKGQTPSPKDKPLSSFKKAGYLSATAVGRVISSVKAAGINGKLSDKKNADRIIIKTVSTPPDACGKLCEEFIAKYGGVTIYRDAEYLKWRLFDNPFIPSLLKTAYIDDRLIGWIAYTHAPDSMGYVVDLMTAHKDNNLEHDAVCLLLNEAIQDMRNSGTDGLRFWKATDHPYDVIVTDIAKRSGFFHIDRGYTTVLYNNAESDRLKTLKDYNQWFINRVFTQGNNG